MDFFEELRFHPIIAAVRTRQQLECALTSPVAAIFLLGGSILTLPELVRVAREGKKRVFVHLDLLEGLGRDAAAVDWCAEQLCPDGMISTRAPLLRRAQDKGLVTIQRLFLMDSSSLNNGIRLLKANPPAMVEVLPGLVPRAIELVSREVGRPVIAGGMVTRTEEVAQALAAGALAVSTSEQGLWMERG